MTTIFAPIAGPTLPLGTHRDATTDRGTAVTVVCTLRRWL